MLSIFCLTSDGRISVIQRISAITAITDSPTVYVKPIIRLPAIRADQSIFLFYIKRAPAVPAVCGPEIKERKIFLTSRASVISEHHKAEPKTRKTTDKWSIPIRNAKPNNCNCSRNSQMCFVVLPDVHYFFSFLRFNFSPIRSNRRLTGK